MHAIETLAFDIALPGERLAFEAQDRLQAFLKGPALRVIESVFDEASEPDETLRLDELVLDLGVLSLDDLPWRWERRLREALTEQLAGLRRRRGGRGERDVHEGREGHGGHEGHPAAPRPGAHRLARSEAEYQSLLHYLQAGVLPWQQVAGPIGTHTRWIDAMVLAHWQALVALLGGAPGPGVRAAGASPQAQALVSQRAAMVSQRLALVSQRVALVRQRLALQLSPALWRSLQALIDAPPTGPLGARSARAQAAAWAADSEPAALADGLHQARVDGAAEVDATLVPPGQAASRATTRSARSEAHAALTQGHWPDAARAWPLLMAEDPAWLTREIRELGRDEWRRERLAGQLDEPRLDDVLALLVPGELGFLGGVRAQLQWVQARAPAPGLPASPPLAPTLRAFTLGFVLADRGSVFNRRSYMAGLVRQLAQRQGVAVAELAQSLSQALAAGGAASDLRREMLRSLDGLTGQGAEGAASRSQAGPLRREDRAAPTPQLESERPWAAQVQAALSQGASINELARLCARGVAEPAPALARVMALLMARLGRDARWPALLAAASDDTWLALAARLQPAHGGVLLALAMGGWGADSATGLSVDAGHAAPASAWPGRAGRAAFWALWWGQWRSAGPRGVSLRALLQAALRQAVRHGQRRAAPQGADLQAWLAALPVAWRQASGPLAADAAPWQRELHSLLASWLARGRAGQLDQGGHQHGSRIGHQRRIDRRVENTAQKTRTDRAKPPAWPWAPDAEAMPHTDPLHIANAGLVLLAAYLPRLFERLGWADGQAWRSAALAQRAVHLLQWAATGEAAAEEHTLVLNKLLCGLPLQAPVPFDVVLTTDEQATTAGLLQAVIAHWTALGATSVDGLRQSFLQREGRLVLQTPEEQPGAWQLQVQARSFDMLLDRLPWSIALIKLPWMEGALHVQWR